MIRRTLTCTLFPYTTLFRSLDNCPACRERVAVGRRVAGFYATKDYSYRSSERAGDGWVLVGDAYGFLDPLYSSGVLLARSEEHTSELQSQSNLVCRLLLENK